jgi:hypothetical protein
MPAKGAGATFDSAGFSRLISLSPGLQSGAAPRAWLPRIEPVVEKPKSHCDASIQEVLGAPVFRPLYLNTTPSSTHAADVGWVDRATLLGGGLLVADQEGQ